MFQTIPRCALLFSLSDSTQESKPEVQEEVLIWSSRDSKSPKSFGGCSVATGTESLKENCRSSEGGSLNGEGTSRNDVQRLSTVRMWGRREVYSGQREYSVLNQYWVSSTLVIPCRWLPFQPDPHIRMKRRSRSRRTMMGRSQRTVAGRWSPRSLRGPEDSDGEREHEDSDWGGGPGLYIML